jgi:hypothetical protein
VLGRLRAWLYSIRWTGAGLREEKSYPNSRKKSLNPFRDRNLSRLRMSRNRILDPLTHATNSITWIQYFLQSDRQNRLLLGLLRAVPRIGLGLQTPGSWPARHNCTSMTSSHANFLLICRFCGAVPHHEILILSTLYDYCLSALYSLYANVHEICQSGFYKGFLPNKLM